MSQNNSAAHPHRYTADLSCTKFVAAAARHEDRRKHEDRAWFADNRDQRSLPMLAVGKNVGSACRPRRQSAIDVRASTASANQATSHSGSVIEPPKQRFKHSNSSDERRVARIKNFLRFTAAGKGQSSETKSSENRRAFAEQNRLMTTLKLKAKRTRKLLAMIDFGPVSLTIYGGISLTLRSKMNFHRRQAHFTFKDPA